MSDGELIWATATDLAREIADGSVRAASVARAAVHQVEAVNPVVNALVHFDPEQVLVDAAALDARQDSGRELGPLHGVPFTIKDLTDVAGLPTTSGLPWRRGHVAAADATVVTRLKAAGGLFLGKTNTPELGYYGGTDNHLFGPTHNPWRGGYTAGGSSGGAAASVACGMAPLAQGSDGAGSIRIPAAMCGVVGFKGTAGLVPHPAPFLDWTYHGPIARTVADAALMLEVIAGHHPMHTPSCPLSGAGFAASPPPRLSDLRIAWSRDLGLGYVDPEVAQIARGVVDVLADLGADVVEATPTWGDPSTAMWEGLWVPALGGLLEGVDWATCSGEIDENLHAIRREAERLTLADYGRAYAFRAQMWRAWTAFMEGYDLVVSPTLATTAFPLDLFAPAPWSDASLREQVLGWLFTYPYNMLNNPAISIPAGFSVQGHPVGCQIAGAQWRDDLVLGVAQAVEDALPWNGVRPPLATGPGRVHAPD